MISPAMTKLIGYLPKSLVKFVAYKLINGYVDKYANITVQNQENLNDLKKPVIYVCNHLSNSDALILQRAIKDDDVTFVAGVKLNSNSLTSMGVSIVKTTPIHPNSADKEGIKRIISIIKNGGSMLIFPEGTRSRTGKLIKAKRGIILIARMCKVPIVPIGMTGTEKLLPINKEGKMEKEKFNYSDINVKIGKPFYLPKKEREEVSKEYDERALNFLMGKIAELLPVEYRGEYLKEK
ncbi:lysophospholipid acyltransferase family protein [Clostridium ganghwense]|uniref:Lysophospholipid acyltransferase family protein n=1 Tax=Clostridium ganghwense TaxID=312089 RepID=A0ABT4CKT0_9CLOT|nr:lysophospholipid acyltransferase family protein [Clostridium ganghwense]MCY6369543.1 lysophospholipid acyltransferase family protein [Clostridium ganghwense]